MNSVARTRTVKKSRERGCELYISLHTEGQILCLGLKFGFPHLSRRAALARKELDSGFGNSGSMVEWGVKSACESKTNQRRAERLVTAAGWLGSSLGSG